MPICVFGNSSNNSENEIDTSLFVWKPCLRTFYMESNIEEDIDLKNQFRIKNLPDPISIREDCIKIYVDNILKNDINFIDGRIKNLNFVRINYQPAVNEHLNPKLYVDTAIDKIPLVENNQDNNFNNHNLTNISSITLNTRAVKDNHVIAKSYINQFHQENERATGDLGIHFYD